MGSFFLPAEITCEAGGLPQNWTIQAERRNLPAVHGNVQPDVLFIHAGGKHRMAVLAEALRSLDVDVDIIADMDVLQEEAVLQEMVLALGGDWPTIKAHADPLRTAIEQKKAWLDASEVVKETTAILAKAPTTNVFSEGASRRHRKDFSKSISLGRN